MPQAFKCPECHQWLYPETEHYTEKYFLGEVRLLIHVACWDRIMEREAAAKEMKVTSSDWSWRGWRKP